MSKALIAKLDEDLKLAGYAKRSRQSYMRSVRQLMNFWSLPLEEIEEQHVREYWLHCKDELDWRPTTMRISYSGIKFFFEHTLKRDWETLTLMKIQRHVEPPVVLSIDETRRITSELPNELNRVFYTTVYSLGLRLGEARHLSPENIDSERMCVRVVGGKGNRTRNVPLPEYTLETLRVWYRTHRNSKRIPVLWDAKSRGSLACCIPGDDSFSITRMCTSSSRGAVSTMHEISGSQPTETFWFMCVPFPHFFAEKCVQPWDGPGCSRTSPTRSGLIPGWCIASPQETGRTP